MRANDPARRRSLPLRDGRPRPLSETYARIYRAVGRIPPGRVATYGQIAALAGLPHAPRVAGYALHALPEGTPLPWHRVVGAGGRLSLAALSRSAALTQRPRLEREGVRFDARGRVDLARHAWRPAGRAVRGRSRPPRRP
jgi:methylated-DNA-protein-cysteine methyltransferase-like protein